MDPVKLAVAARERRKSVRELPVLLFASLRLMWQASRGRTVFVLGVQAVTSLTLYAQVLLINWLLGIVLSVARSGGSLGQAVLPVVLLAALTAATTIAGTIADLERRILGELVSREIWRRLLDVSERVGLRAYEEPEFYDQAQRVQANAAQQTRIVVQALLMVFGDLLGVAAGTVAVLQLAPALVPILLLSGLPLLFTSRISGRQEFDFAVRQTARSRARAYLQGVLTQREEAKEVRAFSLAGALRRRWEANVAAFLVDYRKHVARRRRLALIGNVTSALLTAATLLLALWLVSVGALTAASAGAALIAVRLLGGRVSGATSGVSTMFESSLFLQDLEQFLRRELGDVETPATPAPDGFERITLSGVGFTYPRANRPSLHDIQLELRRGEVVALVGENGSGKTTLAKLLANLYEPGSGVIRWDGVDVRTFDPDGVRRRIAVIFQDFIRYKLTARDNIGLGRPDDDADDEAVRTAARNADADGFLSALPAGYDTLLSKEYSDGSDLSLGQWQRVALARAFVRDVPFVILDEPSASLDARAEHDLFQRIRGLFAGRTVLVISHRFSTVRTADRIVVLDEGRIVEHGDHDSLMAEQGLYADLFTMQASGFLDEPIGLDPTPEP